MTPEQICEKLVRLGILYAERAARVGAEKPRTLYGLEPVAFGDPLIPARDIICDWRVAGACLEKVGPFKSLMVYGLAIAAMEENKSTMPVAIAEACCDALESTDEDLLKSILGYDKSS